MSALPAAYSERVYAGVLGKLIGVYAGRPFEGWTHERIMRELGPVTWYVNDRPKVDLRSRQLVVTDDDVAGTFLFPRALADNGFPRDLSAEAIGEAWLNYVIEDRSVFWWGGIGNSTEHTAYVRLKSGIKAPRSGSIGLNGSTVAEQIGAQIFIDGWGLVSPGDPDLAAHLAEAAGSVSHDGESVHAAKLVAAVEAQAFVERDMDALLDTGLRYVPSDCTIRRVVEDVRHWHAGDNAGEWTTTFARIAERYGYDKYPGNCHIVPNHAVIILALLYGRTFTDAMSIACTAGWDTDCNAGNVGCVMGVRDGLAGIDEGPDWRGPVADRMYLSSADAGEAISDAVIESRRLVRAGHRLAGQPAPANGPRFRFEFPGSVQGFRTVPADASRVVPCTLENPRGGALSIRARGLGAGLEARAATRTFFDEEVFGMRTYALQCAPTLYPGQTVEAAVQANAANAAAITVRLFVHVFGGDDEIETLDAEPIPLAPGVRTTLVWRVPDTAGRPIYEVGIALTGTGAGGVDLEHLGWTGAPETVFRRPDGPGRMWRHAWANDAQLFQSRWEAFRITQDAGRGMIITGTREWTDYLVEARLHPYLATTWGLAARVQGRRRYVAVLFDGVGENACGWRARLVSVCGGEERTLAEAAFAWQVDQDYRVRLTVRSREVIAEVDGAELLRSTNETLTSGGVALLVDTGSLATEAVAVSGFSVPGLLS